MSLIGPSRQAAFFGPTVANGALRTLLDLQLGPTRSRMTPSRHGPVVQRCVSWLTTALLVW